MSDIYDYTYAHVIRQQILANKCSPADVDDETSSLDLVNTKDFTPSDLQLFVDSMETIARLEKIKYERRQERKIRKHQESFERSKKIITCLDCSMAASCADDDAKSSLTSDSGFIYDETYQGQSSYSCINPTANTLKSLPYDSEESGVFLNNTNDDYPLYENIDPIRPRAKVITHPKCKSLKSRLISLIMKKQYIQPEAPIADILSSTTIGEQTENSEIYDRILDDVIQQQFAKKTKRENRRYRAFKKPFESASAEEKILDKAMRLLSF